MRYESIKPFSQAAQFILRETVGVECERVWIKPVIGKNVETVFAIVLGIKGDYEGIIVFEFSTSLTFHIAEEMLKRAGLETTYFSEPTLEKLETVKDVLKEFASLVSGKAVTFLEKEGLIYDLANPLVLFDEVGRQVSKFSPGVEVRFNTPNGWFKITVVFETSLLSEMTDEEVEEDEEESME